MPQLRPASSDADADALFDAFEAWVDGLGLTLYPAQTEALIETVSGANVVLSTPTGSGKSLVATGAHFAAWSQGRRSYYTAPIKALVSEKFFALCDVFGAENVGMLTGDAAVNPEAPIITATAEVLANQALRQGPDMDLGLVVMDEFHYYADPERGWAWQVPLLELTSAQFLLMSATLGDTRALADDLRSRTGRETATVAGAERPVPLHFEYVATPVHETVDQLLHTHQAPVYVVHFSQAAAIERAQALASAGVASREQRDAVAAAIGAFRFTSGFGKTLSRLVRLGIGVHHAGMLPRYRRLVETLAQQGLLQVICGTDTLGVGINVPIRTVLLTGLTKYDGQRQRHLTAREFHQVAGRAGRSGFDTVGYVVAQAPEHEVENARLVKRAGDDPKKLRRVQRKKAPEGFVNWSDKTFERLRTGEPEPLTSSFAVSHGMLLNVIARPGNAFEAMRHLLRDNHEPRSRQNAHIRQAIAAYRTLVAGDVVERLPEPDAEGRIVRLTVDLQSDFALNQPLSPFAVAALDLLDRDEPAYALDVVSVVESTLDDPRPVLSAQRFKARGEAVASMKSEGIEYEERMELLEEVTWPMPLAELLEAGFVAYAKSSPWVLDHQLSPKSVVRDMHERAMTFGEYVGFYGLARSEGTLLRYLTDAYRTLRRTVPEAARTEELTDIVEWLGELVRQTDSSLLDEWESLTSGDLSGQEVRPSLVTAPRPVTGNARAFRVLVRNAMFRRVELLARRRYEELAALDPDVDWAESFGPYWAEHSSLLTDADARGPGLLIIDDTADPWQVTQILHDPEGYHDWRLHAEVDLAGSDEAGEAVVRIDSLGRLG